jgi:hypothetical protein
MPNPEQRNFEYMHVDMFNEWTATELKRFIGSVNTIYNSFCIVDMISNNDIHEKVINVALKQMERYRSIESLPQWVELKDSMEAAYRAVPLNESRSVKLMFTNEIFKILEQYITTSDKLAIDSIEHSSPGGTKFRAPKPIRKSPSENPGSSPLANTQKLIHETLVLESLKRPTPHRFEDILRELETKKDKAVREFILENRIIDPEVIEMIREILVTGPLENLRQLEISGKLGLPQMVSESDRRQRG